MPQPPRIKNRQSNPKVYFDLQLGRGDAATPLGRVVFEVKEDIVPRTATNFAELATRPGKELLSFWFRFRVPDNPNT